VHLLLPEAVHSAQLRSTLGAARDPLTLPDAVNEPRKPMIETIPAARISDIVSWALLSCLKIIAAPGMKICDQSLERGRDLGFGIGLQFPQIFFTNAAHASQPNGDYSPQQGAASYLRSK
jgi:hypothetical protein